MATEPALTVDPLGRMISEEPGRAEIVLEPMTATTLAAVGVAVVVGFMEASAFDDNVVGFAMLVEPVVGWAPTKVVLAA